MLSCYRGPLASARLLQVTAWTTASRGLAKKAAPKAAAGAAKPAPKPKPAVFKGITLQPINTRLSPLNLFRQVNGMNLTNNEQVKRAFEALPASSREIYENEVRDKLLETWDAINKVYRLRKAVPVRMMLPVQRFPRDMYLRMHYADEHRAHPDAGHDQIVRTLLDRFATLGDAEKKTYSGRHETKVVNVEKLREAREAFSRRDFFGKGAKAVGAYTLFLREEFAKVPKGEHLEIADQSPRVAAAWNALSKHEQDQWYAKADKLRAAYNAQRYALEQSLSFEERLVHYYERVRRHMINNKLSLRTAGKRGEHGVASATTTLSGAPVVKALPRPYNLFIKDWFEKKREQKAAGVVETHHVEQFSAASEAWKRLSPVERQVYHDRAAALAAERAAEQ